MELDEDTLDGNWATNPNTGMDFFIINDAIFSKLCILGENVEPCFEGARVTAPEVSSAFTKVDDNFKQTLFSMMQDLKYALEGGKDMENQEVIETEVVEETKEETIAEDSIAVEETSIEGAEETTAEEEAVEAEPEVEEESNEEEVEEESTEDGEETPSEEENAEEVSEDTVIEEEIANNVEADVAETAPEFTLEDYNNLKASYDELEGKYNELVEFKKQVEKENKMSLINSFYMLTDEDKKEVVENIDNYSLEDIEAKLSVICVRKKVNFDSEDSAKNDNKIEEENSTVTTFNLNEVESEVPAWISACINTQNSKNN